MESWECKITEMQSPSGKQQLQSNSPWVREMAGSHSSHLTMLYEELESQKKLLLSSYAHKKCHVILCPHMVSSQQARYPLDEGRVCVVKFITDFFMVCSSRSFLQNLLEFGFANSIQNFFRAEDPLSTPNVVLHKCCRTTSHPSFCRIQVHIVYTHHTDQHLHISCFKPEAEKLHSISLQKTSISHFCFHTSSHFLVYLKKIIQNQTLPLIDFCHRPFPHRFKGESLLESCPEPMNCWASFLHSCTKKCRDSQWFS